MEQIIGYEGLYEIHLTGTADGQPKVWSCTYNKYLTPRLTRKGYHTVLLSKNNRATDFKIHRLVATHFINPHEHPDFTQIDHINRDKTDNRIQNLRWTSNLLNQLNRPGFHGYHWNTEKQRWQVKMKVNGVRLHLGYYKEEKDAANAYVAALDQYHPGYSAYYLHNVIDD